MNFGRFVLTIYLLTLAIVAHAQVLKGTASGTVTDIDGRFELKDLKECNQNWSSHIFSIARQRLMELPMAEIRMTSTAES